MVKLYTLGRCRIETAKTVLTPRARLQFGLAMYLILERGKPVSRRHLLALFWPDRPEEAALHPLREALRKLRRKGLPIPTDDDAQRVVFPKSGAWVDVDGLAELEVRELLERKYTLLSGCEEGLSAVHSDWLDEARAHLHTRIVKQLTEVLERLKLAADWPAVLEMTERILELAPEHKRAREMAMHARKILQGRAGRQMVGVSREVHPKILVAREEAGSQIRFTKADYQASRDTTLVGRDADLRVLTSALQRAIEGHGSGIYLHGEAGIGKSRLVRELANIAKTDGVAVRCMFCQGHDRQRPLSVFVDMVPGLRDLPGSQGCYPQTYEYLDRLTRHDMSATMPKLEAYEVEYLYEHIRQALFDLVEAVAHEQTLVFIVENIQWSDPHSWALLRDMTVRLESQTILFLFTSRSLWDEAAWGPPPEVIADQILEPLSIAASREHAYEYIAALEKIAEPDLVDWYVQVADGNPYFTEELVNNWVSSGERGNAPESLQILLDRRLQELDETALRILQTSAILGRNCTYDRLSAVLQYPDYHLLSGIEALGSRGMLTTNHDTLGDGINRILCRHDVLADRALKALSKHGLQLLHYKAGTILEQELQLLDSSSLLWDCAQHWYAAANTPKAIELGIACAVHLSNVGLTTDALDICKQTENFCSTPADRLKVLIIYIKILHLTCEWAEISRLFGDIHLIRESLGQDSNPHDDLELIRLDTEWNLNQDWHQITDRAMRCIHDASASLPHKVEAGLILLKIGTNMGELGLMDQVYALLSPTISALGPEHITLRLTFEVIYHAICGDLDTCIVVSQELLQFARSHCRGARLARHILTCASGFRRTGYRDRGEDLYAEAFNITVNEKAWALAAIASHQLVLSNLERGNLEGAKEWAAKFENLNRPAEEIWGQRTFIIATILIALESDDIELANKLFTTFIDFFLKDSTVAARANFWAIAIRLKIRQNADHHSINELIDKLYDTGYVRLRRAGLQDVIAWALYLGLSYVGKQKRGQHILSEYVTNFRRDRSPLPVYIQDALNV